MVTNDMGPFGLHFWCSHPKVKSMELKCDSSEWMPTTSPANCPLRQEPFILHYEKVVPGVRDPKKRVP